MSRRDHGTAWPSCGGVVDFNEFLGALDDIGYGGALSVEFESPKYYDLVMTDAPREAAEVSWKSARWIWSHFRGGATC